MMRKQYPEYLAACIAMFSFACLYTCYKLAGQTASNATVVFYQSLWSWLLLLPFCLGKSLRTAKLGLISLRSLLGFGVVYSMTWALKTISVAEATLLNNISPLLVPFVARLWLKDKISHGLWPCLVLGFIGIFIILRPEGALLANGSTIALISGLFTALLVIAARKIAHEPLYKILFYYTAIACLAASPGLLIHPHLPSLHVLLFTGAAGLAQLVGQYTFTLSLRHLTPQHIAPLLYLVVPFSGLLDWLIWDVVPSPSLLIGMGLIILAGLISMRLKKWALILVDPFSSGEPFKTTAREMGYKVIGIYTQTEDIYEKHHSSRAAREHDCDAVFFSSDIDTLVPSLKALPFSIQGCIPTLDMSVSVAMRLSDRLHLIGNPIDMLPYYRDKSFMRKRLRECSLPCPDFSLCHTSEEVRDFARSHTFPLVIKTPQGAGSEQVFICTTEEELLLHFREICEQPNTYGQRVQEAVVEEFLSGTEYIVDVFADGEKIHITDVWFYDKTSIRDLKNIYYNIISLPFDDPIVEKLSAATLRLCDAFKIQKGAVHFELKDDLKRGITLIEINVRLPGAGVPLLLRTTSNWDPFRSTIEVFTKGKTKLPQPIRMKHLAVVMCPLQQGGTVEKIEGIEEIQALPSYVRHVLYIHPGDQIDYTKHLFNLPYLVYLAHTDRAQLLKDVATAHQLFHIVYTRSTGKSA